MSTPIRVIFRRWILMMSSWIGILIVFFLITEICFRVFRKASNPLAEITQKKQTFLFPPNQALHLKSSIEGEYAHACRINGFGYRGADFSHPKEGGKL